MILDAKQLNKIVKLHYFYTLKALWDGQGKIKMYYGMSRVKKQLLGKRSIPLIPPRSWYDVKQGKFICNSLKNVFKIHVYDGVFLGKWRLLADNFFTKKLHQRYKGLLLPFLRILKRLEDNLVPVLRGSRTNGLIC